MTATPLEDAVLRLERAIVRLERQPRPAPPPVAEGEQLALLRDRHQQLRARVEQAVRSLDGLIGDQD
jgi:hypothetical protein